jgi:hypothetical protein
MQISFDWETVSVWLPDELAVRNSQRLWQASKHSRVYTGIQTSKSFGNLRLPIQEGTGKETSSTLSMYFDWRTPAAAAFKSCMFCKLH